MNNLKSIGIDLSRFSPQKLFFILISLQFLIAPFYYQPNFGGEGLYLPYNSAVWIIAVWIIAAASILIIRNKKIILPRYWFGLALLPIGSLISGFIIENTNPTEWLVRISVIFGGYLFFISLFQFQLKPKHIEQSLYILLAMGIISAAYGIFQIHFDVSILKIIPISSNGRPVGIFQQINLQASMMATFLVLIYYLISRPALLSMSFFMKVVLCLSAFLASYTIAASGSRVGLLAATLGLLLLIISRWKLFKLQKRTFAMVLIMTISGATLQTDGLDKTVSKFDRAMGGMETDIRWKVYKVSWELFTEKPLFGHGLGSFQKVFQDKRAEYNRINPLFMESSPRFSHPHNEIVFWLVEGGILSLIGIVVAAIVTFIQLIRIGIQRGGAYASLLIPIVLHSLVELPFYISNTHWLILLFILFITHYNYRKEISTTQLSKSAESLVPITFIINACFSSWILIQAQISNYSLVSYFTSKDKKVEFLEIAKSSFYFRDYAIYLDLKSKIKKSLKDKNPGPIIEFISHTENLIKRTPAIEYYLSLIAVYHSINELDQRDKLFNEAQAIYGKSKKLLRLQKIININKNKDLNN
ncbi:MAG: Wzy polymerase domain-containing protein [Neptuniibacter sp.]